MTFHESSCSSNFPIFDLSVKKVRVYLVVFEYPVLTCILFFMSIDLLDLEKKIVKCLYHILPDNHVVHVTLTV